jgi:hypothetical protein
MANTSTFFGGAQLALGPASVDWDTASGGASLSLGTFASVIVRDTTEYTDLVESQQGTGAADKAETAHTVQVEVSMARPTAERLAAVFPGITIETNSAGAVTRMVGSKRIGQRHSDIWKQMTVTEWVSGAVSVAPLRIVDFWYAAPMGNLEITFDAATQRFVGNVFECYKSDTQLDASNYPTFWKTREVT